MYCVKERVCRTIKRAALSLVISRRGAAGQRTAQASPMDFLTWEEGLSSFYLMGANADSPV